MKVRGTKVAVLGFAPYPWAQSLLNIPAAQRLMQKGRPVGEHLVVVMMHAGAEGSEHQHVRAGTEGSYSARTGETRSPSRMQSCERARIWSSEAAHTYFPGWGVCADG